MREAANCSQLGRNFKDSEMLIVPKVFYDYCSRDVLTIEWMDGTPVSDIAALRAQGQDLHRLAEYGVETFFTQVFRDGFFHADMHPGNILVSADNRYIALDFGIVGSLTDYDKRYLAINFLAFFNRDYHRVATAHIESGWVPPETRAEELEAAVRAVCEPVFNKPISEISFGLVLMRLFEVSRRFNVEIQPQLVLLQKTLLNIEGLGRQLEPDNGQTVFGEMDERAGRAESLLAQFEERSAGLGGNAARTAAQTECAGGRGAAEGNARRLCPFGENPAAAELVAGRDCRGFGVDFAV